MPHNNYDKLINKGLDYLKTAFGEEEVENAVKLTGKFQVEVPAWQVWEGFGGGGRFEGGGTGGAARNIREIAGDTGLIHKLTGSAPAVGFHILWFFSKDGISGDYETAEKTAAELKDFALRIGSISPTLFLAGSEDGSFSAPNTKTRDIFINQAVLGAKIASELGEGLLTFWFPDGTNYPGQRELQDKIRLLKDSVMEFWSRVPAENKKNLEKILFEYKVFEPGTYSTTVPDWGTAVMLADLTGEKGGVLVDLGHHHHGTNIEQIVANLISFGVKGGFHFNTRYAADDDHSVQADYTVARIFHELIKGDVIFNRDKSRNWAFALDQMARSEERIPSILKSIDALKRSIAKAALVNYKTLSLLQKQKDLISANAEFEKALLHADTTPIIMESYRRMGLHPVPLTAYKESGYQEKIERERK
ncbi:L-rhamnose isomerase [candidate division KSB1 bacterium]